THGYGLVMAPVNTVAADGSPLYWIKDIPPHANPDAPVAAALPAVTQPQIYFGLDTNNPVFVDTGAREFDYSTGYQEQNDSYGGDSVAPLAGVNYIRNAVKATIDTYNGTVRFYVADPSDAIVRTIGHAFPGLLRPLAAMPADLRVHVRYPEDLFSVQSEVFAR